MTLSEFKAWFEGYTEGLDRVPTEKQFDRIKEKVKEIDGAPVTPIYIDRYIEKWPHRPFSPGWPYVTTSWGAATLQASNTYVQQADAAYGKASSGFDGHAAMYALGKAEALN
jgi:hypothetical protein